MKSRRYGGCSARSMRNIAGTCDGGCHGHGLGRENANRLEIEAGRNTTSRYAGRKDGCPCVPSDMVRAGYSHKKGQALFLYSPSPLMRTPAGKVRFSWARSM